MKVNKSFGDKIYIEWLDALEEAGWKSFKEVCAIPDEVLCYTSAWFISQDKDFVIVSHTKGKTIKNDIMGKLLIPKRMIRKVK